MVDLHAELLTLIQAVCHETRHTEQCLNAHGGDCICGAEREARFEAELARRLAEPPDLEAVRSDEAVRDAFVDCYTLQTFIGDDKKMNVSSDDIEQWAELESKLITAILAAAKKANP